MRLIYYTKQTKPSLAGQTNVCINNVTHCLRSYTSLVFFLLIIRVFFIIQQRKLNGLRHIIYIIVLHSLIIITFLRAIVLIVFFVTFCGIIVQLCSDPVSNLVKVFNPDDAKISPTQLNQLKRFQSFETKNISQS